MVEIHGNKLEIKKSINPKLRIDAEAFLPEVETYLSHFKSNTFKIERTL